jgi:hypothetical protein
VELLEELRALQRDLDQLGDSVASVLLQRAEKCFLAWRIDDGERYLEQALSRVQESLERQPQAQGAARWFNACAIAVA